MSITKIKIITLLAGLLLATQAYSANNDKISPLPRQKADEAVMKALSTYPAWKSVEYNGNINYSGLPLKPSAKLYMVRDSLIQISVRAPFVGEVLKGEITPQGITVINKLKRTYCQESADNLMEIYPGIISDFQSLMLGRVVVFGEGELSETNAELVEVYSAEEAGAGSELDAEWLFLPPQGEGMVDISCIFGITSGGRTSQLAVAVPSQNISLLIDYIYSDGLTINGSFTKGGKTTSAKLQFNSVKWGGSPVGSMNVPTNYKRTNVAGVFKFS